MRIVIQRVSSASVTVSGEVVASIGEGLCLLVGVADGDTAADVDAAVSKLSGLRVFPDEDGKMNRSITDVGGSALVVSQFTLYGDMRRGRRPSFTTAAPPEAARALIERLAAGLTRAGIETRQGLFGASMAVELVNQGPMTLVLEVRQGSVA